MKEKKPVAAYDVVSIGLLTGHEADAKIVSIMPLQRSVTKWLLLTAVAMSVDESC